MTLHGNVLTSEERQQIRERAEESTSNLYSVLYLALSASGPPPHGIIGNLPMVPVDKGRGYRPEDACFFAHARPDVLRLLDEVDRLAARVAELEAELAGTPPTLDLVRSVSGEPSRDGGETIEWPNGLEWWRASKTCRTRDGDILTTRAAVLAAVAAEKGEADAANVPE